MWDSRNRKPEKDTHRHLQPVPAVPRQIELLQLGLERLVAREPEGYRQRVVQRAQQVAAAQPEPAIARKNEHLIQEHMSGSG